MPELIARIEQFRHADAQPAPARSAVAIEASASCRRAAEFMDFMRQNGINPVPFLRPANEASTATRGHWIHSYAHKQPQQERAKGWPIIVPDPRDSNAPGIRWALLETGRTYRLPLVASDFSGDTADAPVLSEHTVVHPYAHPDVRRYPGAEEWQQVAPDIHGLDVLALAAMRLVELNSAVSLA